MAYIFHLLNECFYLDFSNNKWIKNIMAYIFHLFNECFLFGLLQYKMNVFIGLLHYDWFILNIYRLIKLLFFSIFYKLIYIFQI